MRKVGILTSGGDSPGMNSAIAALTKALLNLNCEVYGIKHGYRGLVEKEFIKLDRNFVSSINSLGGTVLKSSRLPEFEKIEVQLKAVENLREIGIDSLVVIGGDGSFKGALALNSHGINCIALPGTIDNDMSYTDFTIGYSTACQTIQDCIDKLEDTMRTDDRLVVVEVMGRRCGDLALKSAIGSNVNYLITHETEFDLDNLIKSAKVSKERGDDVFVVIVTEGILDVRELAKKLEDSTAWTCRSIVLGHLQRGGSPNVEDRFLASLLGVKAAKLIYDGVNSKALGIRNNELVAFDIEKALNVEKSDNNYYIELFNALV